MNSSPAVERGVVYVGASDGRVHLALANGDKLGTYDVGVPVASSPVIVDGTLYIGGTTETRTPSPFGSDKRSGHGIGGSLNSFSFSRESPYLS